ncbi:TetR/AcrR family transcriptional regulator [Candidatus Poribacteria bacterium]|nr:TetR/AcrR family transcriptional regulator [Candidatus Poribacteria bacterium]
MSAQFLDAALALVAEGGPEAVTVSAVAGSLGAPIGSIYHRFASRDLLLAKMWLRTVESFQAGFLEILKSGDGLRASLYTPSWVRSHVNEGRLLLLYEREYLISGEWPQEVRDHAAQLSRNLDEGFRTFTRKLFGRSARPALQRVIFALVDVPAAAVRRYLEAGEAPPRIIDELVRDTYIAILGGNP